MFPKGTSYFALQNFPDDRGLPLKFYLYLIGFEFLPTI